MKHAGAAALDRLEPLLRNLRNEAGLREKTRGTFYRGSRAFLHFHEHGDELYADVRLANVFERLPATSAKDWALLVDRIRLALRDGMEQSKR